MSKEIFEVIVRRHFRFEAYHDVSGYELEIVRTDKELQSWENLDFELTKAKQLQRLIAKGIQAEDHVPDSETLTDDKTIRVVSYRSIGD
jgi:hypothetical protein